MTQRKKICLDHIKLKAVKLNKETKDIHILIESLFKCNKNSFHKISFFCSVASLLFRTFANTT